MLWPEQVTLTYSCVEKFSRAVFELHTARNAFASSPPALGRFSLVKYKAPRLRKKEYVEQRVSSIFDSFCQLPFLILKGFVGVMVSGWWVCGLLARVVLSHGNRCRRAGEMLWEHRGWRQVLGASAFWDLMSLSPLGHVTHR